MKFVVRNTTLLPYACHTKGPKYPTDVQQIEIYSDISGDWKPIWKLYPTMGDED